MKYSSRFEFIVKQKDAKFIAEELKAIAKVNGAITPALVIEKAKDSETYLHNYFEWNDKLAAHKFRLHQARLIIRCITVDINDSTTSFFHHVSLSKDSPNVYLDLIQCLDSKPLWEQVLHNALSEIQSWTERYKSYQELAPIREAVFKTKEKISGKKEVGKKRGKAGRKNNNSAARV